MRESGAIADAALDAFAAANRSSEVEDVRPWILPTIGVALALAAIYALATRGSGERGQEHEEIDAKSRQELGELLRRSGEEREGAR